MMRCLWPKQSYFLICHYSPLNKWVILRCTLKVKVQIFFASPHGRVNMNIVKPGFPFFRVLFDTWISHNKTLKLFKLLLLVRSNIINLTIGRSFSVLKLNSRVILIMSRAPQIVSILSMVMKPMIDSRVMWTSPKKRQIHIQNINVLIYWRVVRINSSIIIVVKYIVWVSDGSYYIVGNHM